MRFDRRIILIQCCSILKIPLVVFLFIIFALPVFAENIPVGSLNKNIITKIEITGNRVKESVIRNALTFREGDSVDDSMIEQSKKNLYSLGLFKSLDISLKSDLATGGTKIIIDARDGCFILPFPMVGSRAGEKYYAGMLLEQNMFRDAESIAAFSSYQETLSITSISFAKPSFWTSATLERNSYTEYQYSNGEYVSPFISGESFDKLAYFGEPINSYSKESTTLRVSGSIPLSRKIRGTIGVAVTNNQYANPVVTAPSDPGRINVLQLSMNYGESNFGKNIVSGFGRVFGLGMADLADNLKKLTQDKTEYGFLTSLETSGPETFSDYQFSKIAVSANRLTSYKNRSKLQFVVKSEQGFNLPFSQLFATNRRDGLVGVYAREYRGDSLMFGNGSYRYQFFSNRIGHLDGVVFAEYATVSLNSQFKEKEGVGCNFSYQFWRFPLPIGFGYTYSIDDNDWQASVGIGGMI